MENYITLKEKRAILRQVTLRVSRLKKMIESGESNPCDFISIRNLKSFRYNLASEIDTIAQDYKRALRDA